jgi:hypothetical protein
LYSLPFQDRVDRRLRDRVVHRACGEIGPLRIVARRQGDVEYESVPLIVDAVDDCTAGARFVNPLKKTQ